MGPKSAASPEQAEPPRLRGSKISEMVAREIVHGIADRRLAPGTALPPESVMLEQYNVGRASLREALRILEVNGLIAIRPGPGGGPVVSAVTSRDFGRMATMYLQAARATFRELMEARLVMEPLMARLAAERRDPQSLELLQTVIDGARRSASNDASAYLRASQSFHDVIAGLSGNRVLDLFGRSLGSVYSERISGIAFPLAKRDEVLLAHEEIARAIRRGEASRAERTMRVHMDEFRKYATQRYPGLLDEVVDWR